MLSVGTRGWEKAWDWETVLDDLVAFWTSSCYMLLVFICGWPGLKAVHTSLQVQLSYWCKWRKKGSKIDVNFSFSFFFSNVLYFKRSKKGQIELFFTTFPPTIIEYRKENSSKQNCSQTSFCFPFQWLWFRSYGFNQIVQGGTEMISLNKFLASLTLPPLAPRSTFFAIVFY